MESHENWRGLGGREKWRAAIQTRHDERRKNSEMLLRALPSGFTVRDAKALWDHRYDYVPYSAPIYAIVANVINDLIKEGALRVEVDEGRQLDGRMSGKRYFWVEEE